MGTFVVGFFCVFIVFYAVFSSASYHRVLPGTISGRIVTSAEDTYSCQ